MKKRIMFTMLVLFGLIATAIAADDLKKDLALPPQANESAPAQSIIFNSPTGNKVEYPDYGKAVPQYPKSTYIVDVKFDKHRYHHAEGDTWPLTWSNDDNIYAAAGDNKNSPMNFWRVKVSPKIRPDSIVYAGSWTIDLIDNMPVDRNIYCDIQAGSNRRLSVKPAGLLDVNGTIYFAVEAQNYGTDLVFKRQTNIHGWIITTTDYGKTWDHNATPVHFFTGRLASCHFLQFGKGYEGARDKYVYAYFSAADDGKAYWENGDYLLLGRVHKDKILVRQAWEFYTRLDKDNQPVWSGDDKLAVPIFRYNKMTGEDYISYNKDIKRYLLGNYGFVDDELHPRPNHQGKWPECAYRSQLTLYEAPEPWGPWSLFYRDDNWGTYGDYNPSFPTKLMFENGRLMFMVSSGSWDDYNFVVQRLAIRLKEDADFPTAAKTFDYVFRTKRNN